VRTGGRAIPLLAAVTACLVFSATEAPAWTPRMEEAIVRQSMRLMPPSLRRILERHRGELMAGLREAARTEGQPGHSLVPGQKGASTASSLESLTAKTISSIDHHRPFSTIARQMGMLAHFVCDLNNPLKVSDDDPREGDYEATYQEYVAGNLKKYPLVFYGWSDPALDLGRIAAFAESTASRSRRDYEFISRAYSSDNPAPPASRFDERSIPFGIGSLGYSRSVTDTAKVWLHVWREANGDTEGTPLMPPEQARKVEDGER